MPVPPLITQRSTNAWSAPTRSKTAASLQARSPFFVWITVCALLIPSAVGNVSTFTTPSPLTSPVAVKLEHTPVTEVHAGAKKFAMSDMCPWSGLPFGAAFETVARTTAVAASTSTPSGKTRRRGPCVSMTPLLVRDAPFLHPLRGRDYSPAQGVRRGHQPRTDRR